MQVYNNKRKTIKMLPFFVACYAHLAVFFFFENSPVTRFVKIDSIY